ncbi:MAG: hypothetical protein GXY83_03380 [Rhodopirellula sp.]|nr:hypothetical protein [Rhodopirellula sp.]
MADDTDLTDKVVETAADPAKAGVTVGSFSKNFWQQNQPLLAWPFRYGRLFVRRISVAGRPLVPSVTRLTRIGGPHQPGADRLPDDA